MALPASPLYKVGGGLTLSGACVFSEPQFPHVKKEGVRPKPIGEGNGNPLQCSCLKNPRDGGARWAAISGVAQGQT